MEMDTARKSLRMGWTRSLRDAGYPGGQKVRPRRDRARTPGWYDGERREVSLVYREYLDRVREDEADRRRRRRHRKRYG